MMFAAWPLGQPISFATALALLACFSAQTARSAVVSSEVTGASLPSCWDVSKPQGGFGDHLQQILHNSTLSNLTVEKLQRAVQIPSAWVVDAADCCTAVKSDTETYKQFKRLHEQLSRDFPLVWCKLKVETVNELGLLVTWPGSDSGAKPALISANMDVIVQDQDDLSTSSQFEGKIENEQKQRRTNIHGRGAFDKSHLVGLLEALEYTLETDPSFQPKRTIVLALGFDEQLGGELGAAEISKKLESQYGSDSFSVVLGKDVAGVVETYGAYLAPIGVATKQDVRFTFRFNFSDMYRTSPLMPTNEFRIFGNISDALNRFPERYDFTKANPLTSLFQCAANDFKYMPEEQIKDLLAALEDQDANNRFTDFLRSQPTNYAGFAFTTVQQFSFIHGGSIHAVRPEYLQFEIKESLTLDTSVELRTELIKAALKEVGPMGLIVNGEVIDAIDSGITCEVLVDADTKDEPSPNSDDLELLASTIKGLYEDSIFPDLPDKPSKLNVGTSFSAIKTDSSHYKNLSKHVYYFRPGFFQDFVIPSFNTRKEHVGVQTLLYTVAFFYQYVHSL
ncbi:AGL326Wp [Eremothecium gossypii ATCC 10895]|uniref:AGL326Wp n=1 Tax=Eremothecium gossypii (strain ATCC 10895 / CBS 109.51 / FGSC 9923 / NRRL Y-1056) TaxID=284811 RepID=Q751M3_EREGS|nr:AGL326Wp [Eremothecium gossypii ATCC 10895]AAS54165.1 AGL326Wp [Eremothecium gossypii ATCC 10895]